MAQFYAQIQGNRGSATRGGSKDSGIQGHIRGWNSGIRVEGYHEEDLGDIFLVYGTSGSNKTTGDTLIGKLVGGSFHAIQNT